MRSMLACLFVVIALSLQSAAAIAAPQPIDDPDKYAGAIMALLSKSDVASASKKIAATIGKPSDADKVQGGLSLLASRNVDYSDKVIDKTFGESLRQIVYYCFVKDIGFVYFRFNFKRSSGGWLLANFNFKTETNELFPKDFIDQ